VFAFQSVIGLEIKKKNPSSLTRSLSRALQFTL